MDRDEELGKQLRDGMSAISTGNRFDLDALIAESRRRKFRRSMIAAIPLAAASIAFLLLLPLPRDRAYSSESLALAEEIMPISKDPLGGPGSTIAFDPREDLLLDLVEGIFDSTCPDSLGL
jgi:hypothetical protein